MYTHKQTGWNPTKPCQILKVTNQKIKTKYISVCVRIELIDNVTTSDSPLDAVNPNSNRKLNIKAKSPDGILQNCVKAPYQ